MKRPAKNKGRESLRSDQQSIALWTEVLPKCRAEVQRLYDRLDIQFDVELGDGASLSPTGHVVRLILQIGGIILSLWIAGYLPRDVNSIDDEEFS